MNDIVKGRLIIIGGAEDKSGEKSILRYVAKAAGGADARLLILTTATEKPQEVGYEYSTVFNALGIENPGVLNIDSREHANTDEAVAAFSQATGIFFTGGDQLRITSILGGTRAYTALGKAWLSGVPIAGTSAGASVMSNTMIVDGNNNDPARKCTLKMAPGLGFLNGVIIDQHFDQRGRIGRLLCGVAENPMMVGVGIDEDTAICVYPDDHFDVIGTNAVTIIDGTSIESSNVSELKPDEILAISGVTLHVLPVGYGYDLNNKEVLRLK